MGIQGIDNFAFAFSFICTNDSGSHHIVFSSKILHIRVQLTRVNLERSSDNSESAETDVSRCPVDFKDWTDQKRRHRRISVPEDHETGDGWSPYVVVA